MESASVAIHRWMHKENVIHKHNGILFGHKKEWNPAFGDSVDDSGEHNVKYNKRGTEIQMLHNLTQLE
jgi:hypothetical protein